jgi:hypothetical protein
MAQLVSLDNLDNFGNLILFTLYEFLIMRLYVNFLGIVSIVIVPGMINFHKNVLSKKNHKIFT